MDWIFLVQDRDSLAGVGESGNEHSVAIKCGEIIKQLKTC